MPRNSKLEPNNLSCPDDACELLQKRNSIGWPLDVLLDQRVLVNGSQIDLVNTDLEKHLKDLKDSPL